jgi:hypothetical protein
MNIHITRGPDKLFRSVAAPDVWCFSCRARLPHTDELWGDSEPSYYEPVWMRRCSRCGQCRTEFPR